MCFGGEGGNGGALLLLIAAMNEVYRTIPHRPPFLFVDEVIGEEGDSLTARRVLRADEPHFAGHYPGNPIMPGVLLCEAVFQTGAILLVKREGGDLAGRTPVLTRINDARFKNIARPGDELTIVATWKEVHGPFHFLHGLITCGTRKILTIDFGLALIDEKK